jgi:hypothetical protein
VTTASNLLLRLIDQAERVVNRPARAFLGDDQEAIALLGAEIKRAVEQPAPDGRLVGDYELLLAQVLAMIGRTRGDGERAMVLCQVAGVLIPAVRESLGKAIEAQRAPASTTGQAAKDQGH